MTKQFVLQEINNKIETYKKRIALRKNQPCFHDETYRIINFENEIAHLEVAREYVSKIDEICDGTQNHICAGTPPF